MKNPKLEAIAARIAATTKQRDSLAGLISPRRDARLLIGANISAAMAAHESALSALQDGLVRDAVGEAAPGEVATARGAIVAAEKSLATARKSESQARELAAAESGLAARLEPLERSLVELRTELANAEAAVRLAGLESDLHEAVAEYTSLAEKTMAALARAVARHQHLVELGHSPEMMNAGVAGTACGSFNGSPLRGNVGDMLKAERLRIVADHGR